MLADANALKSESAIIGLTAPSKKATKFVIEVIVIDGPAICKPLCTLSRAFKSKGT